MEEVRLEEVGRAGGNLTQMKSRAMKQEGEVGREWGSHTHLASSSGLEGMRERAKRWVDDVQRATALKMGKARHCD